MQKSCNQGSYALSPGEVMSSILCKKYLTVDKKISYDHILPTTALKNPTLIRSKGHMPYVPQVIVDKRPKERYYSLLVPSERNTSPFITVVVGERNDVLRINFVCMSIYECYLYAFGLPNNFPKEQIIVLGEARTKYIPCRSCDHGGTHLYEYELTVPVGTHKEECQQRIINDFNAQFQLEVKVEKLWVVKGSKPNKTAGRKLVDMIWEEQLTMIMRKTPTLEKY